MIAQTAIGAPINTRMSLIEAIKSTTRAGAEISYSTQLVKDWMRVRENPDSTDPVEALREALAAYELGLEEGRNGGWLVVKSPRPEPQAVPPEPQPEETPAPPEPDRLEEIVIVASRHSMYDQGAVADHFLTSDEIRRLPHLADDAVRALHRLPGVAATDFSAPFNLRGGAIDEVKIVVDGVELVEPYHMQTLFSPLSIIDPGIIGQAEVLSGGFTADYGNHMSGVINIGSGIPDGPAAHEVGVSFVSAFARSQGQFDDGRGSWFVSARRGYLDLVAEEVVADGEELEPRFADLFAKLSWDLSDAATVSLQTLIADDDVEFVDTLEGEDSHEDSESQYVSISLDAGLGEKIESKTVLFGGNVETDQVGSHLVPDERDINRRYSNRLRYVGLATNWNLNLSPRHVLRAGARYRDLEADYDYELVSIRRTDFVNNGAPVFISRDIETAPEGDDIGLWGTYRLRLTEQLVAEAGLRWDQQDYADAGRDDQVSPRLHLLYDATDQLSIRAAWGYFYQPHAIHDLQVEDDDLNFYDAERAEHRVLGLRYALASGIELQMDIYDKHYDDVRPRYENVLDAYEFAPESNFDRRLVDPESGRAYGAELTLRQRSGEKLDWWASYTWSRATDRIDGDDIPRSWDQRNALTANVVWRPGKWTLSAVGRYHSGWPRTPLIASPVRDDNGSVVGLQVDLSQRNTLDFDDYWRLDLRASRRVPLQRGSFEYYFELFNVFDATNQCCTSNHELRIQPEVSVSPTFDEFLPRFPSFGFIWRFGPGAE